jgi:hypothetical protein
MNQVKITGQGSQTGSHPQPIPGYVSRQRIGIFAGQRQISLRQPTLVYASALTRNEQVNLSLYDEATQAIEYQLQAGTWQVQP